MHLFHTSLVILLAVLAPAHGATLRQYSRDWLISDLEPRETKRITAKSVFIAPSFEVAPARCASGYREDASGRCVKLVRVSQTAQLDFLLQRLNAMYGGGAPMGKPETAPFQIDLALPVRQHEDCVEASTGTDKTSTTQSSTSVPETTTSISGTPSTTTSTETSSIESSSLESSTETTSTPSDTPSTSESSVGVTTTETLELTEETTIENSTSLEEIVTAIAVEDETPETDLLSQEVVDVKNITTPEKERIPEVIVITNNKPYTLLVQNVSQGVDTDQVTEVVLDLPQEENATDSDATTGTEAVTEESSTVFVSEVPILILDGVKVDTEDFGEVISEPELGLGTKLIVREKDEEEEVVNGEDKETGLEEEKEVASENMSANLETKLEEVLPESPGLPSAEIVLDNVSVGSQIPGSKPTRNSYPGIEEILNLPPNRGENFGENLQSHNLNPSQLVPPLYDNKGPHLNRLPDYPFGLDEIRNSEIPPLMVHRPYQITPNNYNIQHEYPHNYHQTPNRTPQHSYVRFPTDGQRYHPRGDHQTNTVKFPQEYAEEKHREWTSGWRIDRTRTQQQRPPPSSSMRFWPKMPLVRNVDEVNRRQHYERRRPTPQYF